MEDENVFIISILNHMIILKSYYVVKIVSSIKYEVCAHQNIPIYTYGYTLRL